MRLTLEQMAELIQKAKSTINEHIKNVYEEGELTKEATVAYFATVQARGGKFDELRFEYMVSSKG